MRVVFAMGQGDWMARVVSKASPDSIRLRSYYYTRDWPEARLRLEKTTGEGERHSRAVRDWGNVTHDKRRVLEVIRRAKAPDE